MNGMLEDRQTTLKRTYINLVLLVIRDGIIISLMVFLELTFGFLFISPKVVTYSSQGDLEYLQHLEEDSLQINSVAQNTIEITKIDLVVPIIETQETDKDILYKLLDRGVVLYPGSVPFGNSGLTLILGHSAPDYWPDVNYDRAFSKINNLSFGDIVKINYQGLTYNYSVIDTQIIEKNGDIIKKNTTGNILVLMTCWPPGNDQKRIVARAELTLTSTDLSFVSLPSMK